MGTRRAGRGGVPDRKRGALSRLHHSAFDSPEKSLLASRPGCARIPAPAWSRPARASGPDPVAPGPEPGGCGGGAGGAAVAPWLAGTDWLLVLLAAVLVAADGYWVYDLYRTQSVTIEPPVAGTWRLFAGCADTDAAGQLRQPARALRPVAASAGSSLPACLPWSTRARRGFKARIDENGLEPLPPVLDPRRASVLVFPSGRWRRAIRFAFIAENVVEALRAAGGLAAAGSDRALAVRGQPGPAGPLGGHRVKPDVVVSGRYDDSEIRATLAFSDASYRLSLGTEDRLRSPAGRALPLMLPLGLLPTSAMPIQESASRGRSLSSAWRATSRSCWPQEAWRTRTDPTPRLVEPPRSC